MEATSLWCGCCCWLQARHHAAHAADAEHADHDEAQPDNMQVGARRLHCFGSSAIYLLISYGCSGSQ
jgi:hypothetical protein